MRNFGYHLSAARKNSGTKESSDNQRKQDSAFFERATNDGMNATNSSQFMRSIPFEQPADSSSGRRPRLGPRCEFSRASAPASESSGKSDGRLTNFSNCRNSACQGDH
jgi:hypothetical protein